MGYLIEERFYSDGELLTCSYMGDDNIVRLVDSKNEIRDDLDSTFGKRSLDG